MNNLAGPRMMVAIVSILSVPLAFMLGNSVASGSTKPVVLLGGIIVLGVLLLGIPQWLWIFAVGSIFVPGQLTSLPLPFKPMELILMLVMARYVVDDVILKKRGLSLGPSPDKFFVVGLFLVILYHGFQDRFAMRILGSDTWGGRAYVSLIIAFLAYFVVQSTALNPKIFRHLPTIVVLFGAIDFSFNLISTAFPQTSLILWKIYSNVGFESTAVFSQRWGFAGNFGFLLLFWSLADCRIQDFFLKGRFFKAAVFALGIVLCLASGYRSTVAVGALIVGAAAFRDFGFGGILGILPIILLFGSLVFLNSMGMQLPQRIQRGLTWLPGTWDQAASADATGSLDFRSEVWQAWRENEFPKQPLLGRGLGLKVEDMLATLPFTSESGDPFAATISKYTRNDAFVISGNIHHGFYSVVDRFGLVGAVCFVGWTFYALRRIFLYLLSARKEKMDPALQWLGLYIFAFTIPFPIGALRAENFLVTHLFLTGLFLGLVKAKQDALNLTKANTAAPVQPIVPLVQSTHPGRIRPQPNGGVTGTPATS